MSAPVWRWIAEGKLALGDGPGATEHALKPMKAEESASLLEALDEADTVYRILARAIENAASFARGAHYAGAARRLADLRREVDATVSTTSAIIEAALAQFDPALGTAFGVANFQAALRLSLETARRLAAKGGP